MAAVTEVRTMETMPNMWVGEITIATTGDTLETPFGQIYSVQLTSKTTSAADTYIDYDTSAGTVTFNGAGTGFAGTWGIMVVGSR